MANRNRPPAKRDEHGECMHLYLTRDAQCVHCGMQFRLAWSAERGWLMAPLRRNIVFGVVGIALMGVARAYSIDLLAMGFLFIAIYFIVRSGFGVMEVFLKHRFSPGKLGEFMPRSRLNVTMMKPGIAWVGRVRYPMDLNTYGQFTPGDTLLVEYLKWSRLPVAIYRGHLARA